MGLSPAEVKILTIKDFNLMATGYARREEKAWDRARHIMAFQFNYGGFGSTEYRRPQDIFPLRMDKETEKRMITTLAQARELLKEFESIK